MTETRAVRTWQASAWCPMAESRSVGSVGEVRRRVVTGRWCERVESSWYLPRVGEVSESKESVRDNRNGDGEEDDPGLAQVNKSVP